MISIVKRLVPLISPMVLLVLGLTACASGATPYIGPALPAWFATGDGVPPSITCQINGLTDAQLSDTLLDIWSTLAVNPVRDSPGEHLYQTATDGANTWGMPAPAYPGIYLVDLMMDSPWGEVWVNGGLGGNASSGAPTICLEDWASGLILDSAAGAFETRLFPRICHARQR